MSEMLVENGHQQERMNEISSATQILSLVRRAMATELAKAAIIFAVIAVIPYWIVGSTKFLILAPIFFVFSALLTYARRYVPLSKKHNSLVQQYGDIYIKLVASAVNDHGIRTLLKTRWIETYADESCRKASGS